MTAHAHDPAAHADSPRPGAATTDGTATTTDGTATTAGRPRWLLPGLAAGIVVSLLVVAGVLSLSTVIYAGLLGGMLLMHLGGHGGHGGHGSGAAPDAGNLRRPSSGAQVGRSDSEDELDDRASIEESGSETHGHDKRSSHGCH